MELLSRWPESLPVVMLHSGRYHNRWAHYSIISRPIGYLRHINGHTDWISEKEPLPFDRLTHDALNDLESALGPCRTNNQNKQSKAGFFPGGWIGTLSYDLGRLIEPTAIHTKPEQNQEIPEASPLYELAYCPSAYVYDYAENRWYAVGRTDHLPWSDDESPDDQQTTNGDYKIGQLVPTQKREDVEQSVARTIEYIKAGDIFQANISQQFNAQFSGDHRTLFHDAMRTASPWYAAYLELDTDRSLISLSPELFIEINGRATITRPIKGTRPATSPVAELENSEKDTAELNMIVDLMRNDLGRVAEYGSVEVVEARCCETHPTVHHGVATIQATLREEVKMIDILNATFPPGSITGAPKIRAMQIIDELEVGQRGPFFGSIGWFGFDGNAALNVAIRTLLVGKNQINYMAGGGIVADSVPTGEYEESLTKTAVVKSIVHMKGEPEV